MVKLENINFSYGDKMVLEQFNLSLPQNKIVALLGSTGSGKTTILRLIAGLEMPERGKIFIKNKIVSDNGKNILPPHKRKVGFVFQDLALWPHFNVFKNITFGLNKNDKKSTFIKEIFEFFSLSDLKNKYPHQLSGGQQQMVAIARAMALNPEILLMDEPLANLDVKLKHKILEYIKRLRSRFGTTVIYVTHDHHEAFSIADYVVVLNKGNIEASGTVEEIKMSNNEYVKFFLEY